MSDQKWHIEGEYFESCNCELLCPCLLSHAQARPTEGHCDVVLAIHIAKGSYDLRTKTYDLALEQVTKPTPGQPVKEALDIPLELGLIGPDGRDMPLDLEGKGVLNMPMIGRAGGPPSLMAPFIAHLLPTKVAPISFSSDGKTSKVSITGITDVTVEGVIGAGNQVVFLDNVGHPYSHRLAAARGTSSRYKDHSLSFENSGRNGHFSAINWSN